MFYQKRMAKVNTLAAFLENAKQFFIVPIISSLEIINCKKSSIILAEKQITLTRDMTKTTIRTNYTIAKKQQLLYLELMTKASG